MHEFARAIDIAAPKDTVLLVKWECAVFFQFACGGLHRPAHNQLSHLSNRLRTFTAVPLGCGQLRAGFVFSVSAHSVDLPAVVPVVRIKRLSFRDHRIRQVQQLARCRTARHFRRLAHRPQALILCPNEWIVPRRAQACHI